jgi:hypothetical protein
VPLVEVAVQQQDGKQRSKHHLRAAQHLEHCVRRSSNRQARFSGMIFMSCAQLPPASADSGTHLCRLRHMNS